MYYRNTKLTETFSSVANLSPRGTPPNKSYPMCRYIERHHNADKMSQLWNSCTRSTIFSLSDESGGSGKGAGSICPFEAELLAEVGASESLVAAR